MILARYSELGNNINTHGVIFRGKSNLTYIVAAFGSRNNTILLMSSYKF